jgi:hypothetical protein
MVIPSLEKVKKNKAGGKGKIWIDLDNSPHVLFFGPIIKELKGRGYQVVVTARDYAQVIGLADLFNLEYTRIGHHYGKNIVFKIVGVMTRAAQMVPFIRREKPDLAFSHGSRGQVLAAGISGVPSVVAFDYEYTNRSTFFKPFRVFVPEVIAAKIKDRQPHEILPYPGIKEDVYVQDHTPDSSFLDSLGISAEHLLVVVRPPATVAHYHAAKSDELFNAVIEYLGRQADTKVIIVPRTKDQADEIRKMWPPLFDNGRLIIPDHVVNGLDLIWYSDMVISAGGTMIREAAALGVPSYSIFGGPLGAVDQHLSETGRLVLITKKEDVPQKIKLEKWSRPEATQHDRRPALRFIVDSVEALLN